MKEHCIYLICLLVLAACNTTDDTGIAPVAGEDAPQADIILQPRNPGLTHVLSNPKPELDIQARSEPNPLTQPYKFLGYTYRHGNCIVGHPANIGRQIVDVESLITDEYMKDYIDIAYIRDATSQVMSYSGYDRFEKHTQMTEKVESGFSLNLGLFKIGRKKTITETFNTGQVDLSQELIGEVTLEYVHSKVWLDNISNGQKRIATNHVKRSFVDNLFNSPISEIVNKWGPYVLSHYYTGGRATALYVAESNMKERHEDREKDMNKNLNASFAWKVKSPIAGQDTVGSASANFGYGYKDGNSLDTKSEISNVYNQIKISGGATEFQVSTKVDKVADNTLDLSPWFRSLVDENTHVIIDIAEEGLVGLDKFVLEENFKRRIRDTYMEYLDVNAFDEPFIEIVKVYVRTNASNEKLYDVAAVLNTRQGDKIVLSDGLAGNATDAELRSNNNNDTFMAKANEIARQKAKYYQCEVRTNPQKIVTPYLRTPLAIELKKFDESSVYKYKNPKTNIWYIYDTKSRIAYSYYDEEYIPWVYGMLDWFTAVPEKSIPMSTLYQLFTIIGL